MNIHKALTARGITPTELSKEEFEEYYASLYNLLGSKGSREELRHICNDVICMYQLRQAGYGKYIREIVK